MTELEKIKAEISEIFEKYKQMFYENNENKESLKTTIIISSDSIYRTIIEIKSDMIFEMHEAMNKHIEFYGNADESEIIKHIRYCDLSFDKLF